MDSSCHPCAAARRTPGPLLPSAPLCCCQVRGQRHLQGAERLEANGDSPTLPGHCGHCPVEGTPGLARGGGWSPGHTRAAGGQSRRPRGSLSLWQAKWPPGMGQHGPPYQPQQLPVVTSPAFRYTSWHPCGRPTARSAARDSDTKRAW